MQRLPKGEETLPFYEIDGRFLTLDELRRLYPTLYEQLGIASQVGVIGITDALLIERVRMRIEQGRVPTIYRLACELSPAEQLRHMRLKDEIGLELIEAERKLLEEELRMLGA